MSMLSRFASMGGGDDPYWANVSYLLVGNGANATTTNIKDSSSNNLATTVSGSVVISTAQSKFGSGSVNIPGSGYVQVNNNAVLNFGSGDFTIEYWVNYTTVGQCPIVGKWSGSAGEYYIGTLGSNIAALVSADGNTGGGTAIITSGYTIPTGSWIYVAVVKSGTTISIYINGTRNITGTFSGSIYTGTTPLKLGQNPDNSQTFNGYIYDLRITKGVARYSGSTMTVPTAPLPIG